MEACLKEAVVFKKVIDAIRGLVTDVNIDFSPQGMALQAMDTSHVSLVSLKLGGDCFKYYTCSQDISLGLNMEVLNKAMSMAKNNHELVLAADVTALDVVNFQLQHPDKTGEKIDLEIKLMDIDSEHLGIPDTDYQSVVQLPSAAFQEICQKSSNFSDTITISTAPDTNMITFSISGDQGSVDWKLPGICKRMGDVDMDIGDSGGGGSGDAAHQSSVYLDVKHPIQQSFALRYLLAFTKATPLSPTVTLCMSNDVPIKVYYGIAEQGYLSYYLAPKIDE